MKNPTISTAKRERQKMEQDPPGWCFVFFYVQVAVAVSHSDPLLDENVCIPT